MGSDDTEKSTVHNEAIPVQDLVHCNPNTVPDEAIPVKDLVHSNVYMMNSK